MPSHAAAKVVPGSLVRARGRDWVVLPSREPDLALLRPLTGSADETIGLFLPLEGHLITPSTFPPPDPAHVGDTTGCLLLYDAARLSLRSGAAPFRSLGHISVVPRPYQFVPLIMALRMHPVRLLIADDVGVGKTIEAALIARELLDRGIARRLAVICPAHLCSQWADELREKFALDPKVVQPSQIARLERELPRPDMSIYRYYPHLVLSIDFVKSERQRDPFLRNAPDLIVIDEAHTAARPRGERERVQHERHAFVRQLAADQSRHLILVTATPHSGIEESFRSLLGLLRPELGTALPTEAVSERRRLLPYIVQRRRQHLERWLGAETPFPERLADERPYQLSERYHQLFDDVLDYCRETVHGRSGLRAAQQRVRHWAAITLLRCLLSSPGAAEAVLATRSEKAAPNRDDELPPEEIDALFRPQVLDPLDEESLADYVPAAPLEEAEPHLTEGERRRLADFRRRARALANPDDDRKIAETARAVADLLREGYRPIVFCRFIPTAEYVAQQLGTLLKREFPALRAVAVTGESGDDQLRRALVADLVNNPVRVLVATDCLSEGINLQQHFDAVLHYDLPWNPNRLEQREGRVDRFGQPRDKVRTVLLYGANSPVDLVVLDVLIRKARLIHQQLGVAVPVPVESEQVVQAVVDNVLLRGRGPAFQYRLAFETEAASRLHAEWDAAAQREGEQRAFFAQYGIQPDEVAREIEATDPVLGSAATVARFLAEAAQRFGGELCPTGKPAVFDLHPGTLARPLAERGFPDAPLRLTLDRLQDEQALYVGRTHPIVAAYCDAVLGAALAEHPDPRFARAGATYTDAVARRTAVVLLRLRYLLREQSGDDTEEQFAEEIVLAAFQRRDGKPVWLEPLDSAGRDLIARVRPKVDLPTPERAEQVAWALRLLQEHDAWWASLVEMRVQQLKAAHDRLRALVKASRLEVKPSLPPDILGCYVLLPAGGGR